MWTDSLIEVLVTITMPPKLLKSIQNISPRFHIAYHPAYKASEIPDEQWARTDILFTNHVDPDIVKAPNLKWIQFFHPDDDMELYNLLEIKPNLLITTMRGISISRSAEYCLAMMMMVGSQYIQLLKDPPAQRMVNPKRYVPRSELSGSTVGIVGYDSPGREIARQLQPFGATILAAKENAMDPRDHSYARAGLGDPEGDLFDRLYPIQAVRSMVKVCDFVIITTPHTPHTHHLVNRSFFAEMKSSAYLIDISQPGVVNLEALEAAIRMSEIQGAILDTIEMSSGIENHPLTQLPNVLLTPNIATRSNQYLRWAVQLFSENLERFLNQEPLINWIQPAIEKNDR
ncbi:MAG: hypothetical protein JW750_02085 [Anaerolineaceae bacterium]|nr:hypothetical protein [Anaerolineaceae bacterium]